MTPGESDAPSISILLLAEDEERSRTMRQLVHLVLPRASIISIESRAAMEEEIPAADAALIDGGTPARAALDALRFLRARGFRQGIVVVAATGDDAALRTTAQSLGAECITRGEVESSPVALGAMLTRSIMEGSAAVAELAQARRIFAAGQAALSLQHSINNPLAALLAEAQILQLEQMPQEQQQAVERIIELCRRIVTLVRRLDVLSSGLM
jgi:signal transduction histidine kinase